MSFILKTAVVLLAVLIVSGCAARKQAGGKRTSSRTDTRTVPVEFLNERTFRLTVSSPDATYGYSPDNPVKVGGVRDNSGPLNERRFLNALLGPNGEDVSYQRTGSCCPFKTPNGTINNTGLLDRYLVYWQGSRDTLYLYFNLYDEGNLLIPVGFTARKYGW